MWSKVKKIGMGCILSLWMLCLVSCGSGETGEQESQDLSAVQGEYVPTFTEIKDKGEAGFIGQIVLKGNTLYYSLNRYYDLVTMKYDSDIIKMDINAPDKEETLELQAPEIDGYNVNISDFDVDDEGNFYVFYYVSPLYEEGESYDYEDVNALFVKYDSSMQEVFRLDLEEMQLEGENIYIGAMACTKDRIYAASGDMLYVLDTDGAVKKQVNARGYTIVKLFAGAEDRIFIEQYSSVSGKSELVEFDTKKNEPGAALPNLPDTNVRFASGAPGKLLAKGDVYLYEYDLETGEMVPIVNWLESNINCDYIMDFALLEDGNIFLIYEDMVRNTIELVKLNKVKASELPERETIVCASLYNPNQALQNAIIEFNRKNTRYKIVTKYYIDNTATWDENTLPDGRKRMQADLLGSNPPDIIDLSEGDIASLERAGVLEDLYPYLQNSQVIKAEDFVPTVLNAYTYHEHLVTIPGRFRLETMMGKKSLVGDRPGWTLDQMIALAEQYPDADLRELMTPEINIEMCLQYNSAAFVDYETGTCHFDSPEFVKILEFAKEYVAYPDSSSGVPSQLQKNTILLNNANIGDVQEFQMRQMLFGEPATCIGYPTADGSPGVFIYGSEMYGITTQSTHKEGAWEFLEYCLDYKGGNTFRFSWGFPTRVDELEEVFLEAQTPEYKKDHTGAYVTDAAGEPIERPKTSWAYDDWEADIYAATPEQIEELRTLIELARPVNSSDSQILQIISEEAQAYFKDKKTAEEVAKIIQSRVNLYVNENR